jgi:hypothetical protein
MGQTRMLTGDFTGAIASYDQALAVNPDSGLSHYDRGISLLVLGRTSEAWPEFEWRFHAYGNNDYLPDPENPQRILPRPSAMLPVDLSGKRLLAVSDQGLGDELFFLRFAKWLQEQGAWLAYQPGKKLASMLERSDDIDQIVPPGEPLPDDIDIILSVPELALLTDDGSNATPSPLSLSPRPDKLEAMQKRLQQTGKGPYLAVTWMAGTRKGIGYEGMLFKEISAGLLGETVADWPGEILVVQRNPDQNEYQQFLNGVKRPVHDFTDVNDDLEVMLALMDLVDDYAGVSNTNMHLRAGLHKPARVLVPFPPEYRWQAAGVRSPWFPNFIIYRQSETGDWEQSLAALQRDLSGY